VNLHDAIKSGKPYRRKGWKHWRQAFDGAFLQRNWMLPYTETVQDVTADDWETLEPTVTITRTQLGDAVLGWMRECAPALSFDKLASKLGLGDHEP
jgi:hypothetical protein